MTHTKQTWHYNTHEIVTRIPEDVGVLWENGYKIQLKEFECVPATSKFSGEHMGGGNGPDVLLAMSDCGFCLIKPRRYTFGGCEELTHQVREVVAENPYEKYNPDDDNIPEKGMRKIQ